MYLWHTRSFSNLRAAFIIRLCSTIVMWMDCVVHHCPISLSMATSIYSVVGTHIASTGCSSDAAATSRGGKKQDAHSHSHCSKRRAFGKIRTKEECVVCVCVRIYHSRFLRLSLHLPCSLPLLLNVCGSVFMKSSKTGLKFKKIPQIHSFIKHINFDIHSWVVFGCIDMLLLVVWCHLVPAGTGWSRSCSDWSILEKCSSMTESSVFRNNSTIWSTCLWSE